MSISYLDQKSIQLETQEPVDPSNAQIAQIPLQTFSLPPFPPSAQNLTTLTLTSDITPSTYPTLLQCSSLPPLPPLPQTIENLTLELFSLGYPPPFLTNLSKALPSLKTLVIYSQIFTGTTEESLADAVSFFRNEMGIMALHLLDVFVPRGVDFFGQIGEGLRESLRFLEINYTFRHDRGTGGGHREGEGNLLDGLPVRELHSLVGRGLLSCVFGMSAPEAVAVDDDDDNDDSEVQEKGILAAEDAGDLVKVLTGEERPRGLLALDVTLFKLTLEQLEEVVGKLPALKILAVTVEVSEVEGLKSVTNALEKCDGLEEVEIVGFPRDESFVESIKAGKEVAPTEEELEALLVRCKELRRVKISILRTRDIVWEKEGGKWKKT